jgi:hypothetical protein
LVFQAAQLANETNRGAGRPEEATLPAICPTQHTFFGLDFFLCIMLRPQWNGIHILYFSLVLHAAHSLSHPSSL